MFPFKNFFRESVQWMFSFLRLSSSSGSFSWPFILLLYPIFILLVVFISFFNALYKGFIPNLFSLEYHVIWSYWSDFVFSFHCFSEFIVYRVVRIQKSWDVVTSSTVFFALISLVKLFNLLGVNGWFLSITVSTL